MNSLYKTKEQHSKSEDDVWCTEHALGKMLLLFLFQHKTVTDLCIGKKHKLSHDASQTYILVCLP
jgi:hypothetical protein